nr:MAG TPA: TATA-box binding protein [Caudoviricetes sp.]
MTNILKAIKEGLSKMVEAGFTKEEQAQKVIPK